MARGLYHILSEATEDHFGDADTLAEAIRIARDWASDGQPDGPVLIEFKGKVIHQLVVTPDGHIAEESIG